MARATARVRARARVLVLAAMALGAAAPVASQPVPPPARTVPAVPDARGPITVGVVTDSYPFSFVDGSGPPKGFVVDLLAAIEETMGLRLERVYGTTEEINGAFERGELDMLQTYAESPSRQVFADFSVPYLSMAGSIFVRRDLSGITRLADLKGRRVLVHSGSLGDQLLQSADLADSVVHVASVEQAFRDVDGGRGDATLASRLTGLMAIERGELSHVVAVGEPVPGYTVRHCFGVRDGDRQLLARLNEGLAIIERTGQASAIYDRWFSRVEPRRYSPFAIALAVAGGLAVALMVAVWSMLRQRALSDRLRRQEEQMRRAQKLEAIGTLSSGIAHEGAHRRL